MTYYLILIVAFAGAPSLSAKFLVPAGADACIALASSMLKEVPPPWRGHASIGWTVGCFAVPKGSTT